MAHPRYWQPEKREFSDDEMYYVIYAQHNGVGGLECAERLGIHPGVVNSIYEARWPYMDQAIRVGRRVQFDRTEEPNCERRRLAAQAQAQAQQPVQGGAPPSATAQEAA